MVYRELFALSGKTAIVTGGAGILGRHFCRALAEYGAKVAIVDLHSDEVAAVADALRADGLVAEPIVCNVADPNGVAQMVRGVVAKFGGIDILLNNAASKSSDLARFFQPLEEFSSETWREVMAVNLDAMFLVAQAVGRQLLAQGRGGSIIQTSSVYGVVGPDNRIYDGSRYLDHPISTPPVYSASKAGVIGLTRHLAAHWGAAGIRVNALVPGGIQSGQNETFVRNYAARVPLGRMGQAIDLVGAVIFLASDASRYLTGQCLIVDGGLTAW